MRGKGRSSDLSPPKALFRVGIPWIRRPIRKPSITEKWRISFRFMPILNEGARLMMLQFCHKILFASWNVCCYINDVVFIE